MLLYTARPRDGYSIDLLLTTHVAPGRVDINVEPVVRPSFPCPDPSGAVPHGRRPRLGGHGALGLVSDRPVT